MSSAAMPSTAMSTVFSERRSDLVVTARETPGRGRRGADPGRPDRRRAAGLDAGRAHRRAARRRPRAAVLAVRLAGRPAQSGASACCSTRTAAAARGGCTSAAGRATRWPCAGPRNHFPLLGAGRYIFLAGGIGITPILPMIAAAAEAGADWQLCYGGRSRASMAFLDELEPLRRAGARCGPRTSRGCCRSPRSSATPADGALVYCCGPEGLLAAVEQRCASWPAGALHLERFAAKPQEAPAGGEAGFEVVCQRSGVTVTVPPGTVDHRRAGRERGQRALVVPGGRLRHVRDAGHRGHPRPPRLAARPRRSARRTST